MAGSVNKVFLIGSVGKEPQIRTTQDGRKIASFSLATNETWRTKEGERKERTDWHSVVVFNPGLTKVIESYVKKGSKLWVEGSLQTRKWQDKDGKDKYVTEIILSAYNGSITLLDSKPSGDSGYAENKANGYVPEPDFGNIDDEIPF